MKIPYIVPIKIKIPLKYGLKLSSMFCEIGTCGKIGIILLQLLLIELLSNDDVVISIIGLTGRAAEMLPLSWSMSWQRMRN